MENALPAVVDRALHASRTVLLLRLASQAIHPRLVSQVTRQLLVNRPALRLVDVRKQQLRRVLARAMTLPQLPLGVRVAATVQLQHADKCVGHY